MLKNVKSQYIFRYIFVYINEKRKLKLIRNNRHIQTKLNIKLINYRIFSGKYMTTYENNKKGKIFDAYNDILIFDGEFSNGKINGYGKEYYYKKN